MTTREQRAAEEQFAAAQEAWRLAVDAHRLAPPDAGFSARLAALAGACRLEAMACRAADLAGYEWPPHRAGHSNQPWELRPESGRRGPADLWRAFDIAVSDLERAGTTTSLIDVAAAHERLAEAAAALAEEIEAEDRRSGLLPAVRRRRRSA
jgi:hypothetical protein